VPDACRPRTPGPDRTMPSFRWRTNALAQHRSSPSPGCGPSPPRVAASLRCRDPRPLTHALGSEIQVIPAEHCQRSPASRWVAEGLETRADGVSPTLLGGGGAQDWATSDDDTVMMLTGHRGPLRWHRGGSHGLRPDGCGPSIGTWGCTGRDVSRSPRRCRPDRARSCVVAAHTPIRPP
jgi:hypothetical protein